jgi:hypothetical protein
LWNEAFLPLVKSYIGTSEKGKHATISFDVPSLIGNRDMVRGAEELILCTLLHAAVLTIVD